MGFKKFTASATQLQGDPRYNSKLAAKFVNCMMWDGKKGVATRTFYEAMDRIAEKITDTPAVQVFEQAVENVKPNVEVRSKRVGGANYQVPMSVKDKRRLSLSIRWILLAARGKKGRPMAVSLAEELMAAFRGEGDAMKKREDVHRMADANKAFAHFGW